MLTVCVIDFFHSLYHPPKSIYLNTTEHLRQRRAGCEGIWHSSNAISTLFWIAIQTTVFLFEALQVTCDCYICLYSAVSTPIWQGPIQDNLQVMSTGGNYSERWIKRWVRFITFWYTQSFHWVPLPSLHTQLYRGFITFTVYTWFCRCCFTFMVRIPLHTVLPSCYTQLCRSYITFRALQRMHYIYFSQSVVPDALALSYFANNLSN